MTATDPIILTQQQRGELLKVFGAFAPPVERVDMFGSRATGGARIGSDADLVLAGQIDERLLARISGALADSYLSIFADVTAYAILGEDDFARSVRRTARPLFDAAQLAAAPPFRPVDGRPEWYRP